MAKRVVKRSSVVLVHYPFTNLTGVKVRPAVILTPDELLRKLGDVLCLFISSSIPADLLPTDFVLETTHPSFGKTGLKYRSVFRTHKLALLQKSLVLRVLGEMDKGLMNEINQRLRIALGL
ncbi:type II toxin-antitoxin system PemK/MazF family toxin [bacterium]|nr:type II toxin-antitoxin system PemK/MazF family toxin [bacterium]